MKKPARSLNAASASAARNEDECRTELAHLDQAHIQNEATRDAFLALAHTGLFAASIAFIGGISQAAHAKWLWLLLLGWFASVIGLLALTLGYHVTSRHIDRRRQQIYDQTTDVPKLPLLLNHIALWSFPLALISTFVFATINMLAR